MAATTTIGVPGASDVRERPVGPWWQTAAIAALFLALAVGGAVFQHHAQAAGPTPGRGAIVRWYISVMAAEWALVFWIWKGGLRRTGTTLGELIGGRWSGWRDVLRDAALALLLWAFMTGVLTLWTRVLGAGHAASIQGMLPRGAVEVSLWLALSITAGCCEETVFRGYLQRQFAALTRSAWLGVILQAALFGIGHGYQGVAATLRIALFGLVFGAFAVWRRSLRPGIIAHAWTDVASGIFGI